MLILVTYDVSTETSAGRRRLRMVAKICQDYGQRVQKSVFECRLNNTNYLVLENRLLDVIDLNEDSLRLYRITDLNEQNVKEFGNFRAIDFEGPLIF